MCARASTVRVSTIREGRRSIFVAMIPHEIAGKEGDITLGNIHRCNRGRYRRIIMIRNEALGCCVINLVMR